MTSIITIYSSKDGGDKSALVANFATLLAVRGKRVGLTDSDMPAPYLEVLFGREAPTGNGESREARWEGMRLEKTAYRLGPTLALGGAAQQFLRTGVLPLTAAAVPAGRPRDLAAANTAYRDFGATLDLDYMVIDAPPGLGETTLFAIAVADSLIAVLRPEAADFQATAAAVDVARKLATPEITLVIHEAGDKLNYLDLQRQVEGVYNAPVAAMLPLTPAAANSAIGNIFALRYPTHPWSSSLRALVERFAPA